MEKEGPECLLKIVVIGDSGVGKTNLLFRFIMDRFNENTKTTIGVEFYPYDILFNGKNIKI